MNKYLLRMSFVAGLLIAVFLLGYFAVFPVFSVLPLFFAGLTITFAYGPDIKQAPNYVSSIICGLLWAFAILWFRGFLGSTGMNSYLAFFLETWISGTCICIVHLFLLEKAWPNKLPLVFSAVFSMFLTNGAYPIAIVLTLISGVVIALLITPLTNLTIPKKNKSDSLNPATEND